MKNGVQLNLRFRIKLEKEIRNFNFRSFLLSRDHNIRNVKTFNVGRRRISNEVWNVVYCVVSVVNNVDFNWNEIDVRTRKTNQHTFLQVRLSEVLLLFLLWQQIARPSSTGKDFKILVKSLFSQVISYLITIIRINSFN